MENEEIKYMTVGSVIKEIRISKRWKQSEMAKRLKIATPTLSKIESNKIDITVIRLQEIANIFNVPLSELLGESVDKDQQLDLTEFTQLQEKYALRTQQYLSLQSHFVEMLMKLDELRPTAKIEFQEE
jgi:transcriptional regulator with XRE-family HTH domain